MSTPMVTKVATAPPVRERLRREAAALRRAAHPNVVRLASFLDGTDRTELHVEHAGEHTLLTTSPPDGPTAVACAASLAATIADLHGLGVVHGRLTPDHIVVAPGGRAVLCGLSEAREGDFGTDIRALATLLEVLAAGVPSSGSRRDRRAVSTLLAVADRARNGDPPPAAAELARLLGAHPAPAPTPAPPTTTEPRSATPGFTRQSDTGGPAVLRVALIGAGALAMLGMAVWFLRSSHSGGDGAGPPWTATLPPTSVTTARANAHVETTVAPSSAPVQFVAEGATFEVGRSGDIVVTGDWDCDGRPGAALLRPASTEVFVFDDLPAPDQPLPGRPLGQVADAVRLETIEQPNGCDSLIARRADGGSEVLAVVPR